MCKVSPSLIYSAEWRVYFMSLYGHSYSITSVETMYWAVNFSHSTCHYLPSPSPPPPTPRYVILKSYIMRVIFHPQIRTDCRTCWEFWKAKGSGYKIFKNLTADKLDARWVLHGANYLSTKPSCTGRRTWDAWICNFKNHFAICPTWNCVLSSSARWIRGRYGYVFVVPLCARSFGIREKKIAPMTHTTGIGDRVFRWGSLYLLVYYNGIIIRCIV